MVTQAKSGYGTVLSIAGVPPGSSSSGGGTYTAVAEKITLKGPNISAKALKATNQTTSGGAEEYIPSGLVDGGEVEVTGNFVPAEHETLITAVDTIQAWQIAWPQTGTHAATFEAIITDFEPSSEPEKPLEFSAKLKVTGPVTFT